MRLVNQLHIAILSPLTHINAIKSQSFLQKTIDLVHPRHRLFGPPVFCDDAFDLFPQPGEVLLRRAGEMEQRVREGL